MRLSLIWAAGLAPSISAAACNGDNCAAALKKASAVNTKDCQSFLTKTVTPCPSSTTTVTTTTVVTRTIGSAPHNKRDIHFEQRAAMVTTCPTSTANAPPTYASPCSGTVRYSSACSCLGVTPGSTTIASPLATATSTITSTSTVTAVCSTFQAKATSGAYAGHLLVDGVAQPYSNILALGFSSNISQGGDTFQLIGNHIYGNGGNPSKPWRAASGYTYVFQGTVDNENVQPTLNCTLSAIAIDGTARITCLSRAANPGSTWQTCPGSNALDIGPGVYDGGEGGPEQACTGLDLITIPKC